MKTCDTCNAEKTSIPYVVHEATATRLERINTRLWVVVLILIFALIASNLAWIIYEKQFEVIESDTIIDCEQSGEGTNMLISGRTSAERFEPLKVQGESEFLRTASGKDAVKVFGVMDEFCMKRQLKR